MRIETCGKVVVFAAVCLLFCACARAADTGVRVDKVVGKVEARAGAGEPWRAAKSGDRLSAGAAVRTGKDSSCVIKWGVGNAVKVSPLSDIDLESIDLKSKGMGMSLKLGRASAHIEKMDAGGSFTVRTPAAIAGVRGTDFFAEVGDNGGTVFGVAEGEIFVTVGDIEIPLSQDYMVEIPAEGGAGEPEPMTQEMKQEANEEMKELKEEAAAEVKAAAEEDKEEKKEEKEEAKDEKKEDKDVKDEKAEGGADEKKEEGLKAEGEKWEEAEGVETGGDAEPSTEDSASDAGAVEPPASGEPVVDTTAMMETVIDTAINTNIDNIINDVITNDTTEAIQDEMITGSVTFEVQVGQ